jgi:AcrR family transcriptional regulator
MAIRKYRLGRRQPSVDRTRAAILAAARELVSAGSLAAVSVGAISRRAGVSRITVYNQFGSKAALIAALAARPGAGSSEPALEPLDDLRRHLSRSCAAWSSNPALFRNLPHANSSVELEEDRTLAERLAAADRLRPGCSIKEAQDVIGVLRSFGAFDALHRDGRRPVAAVAEILMRLAAGILSPGAVRPDMLR